MDTKETWRGRTDSESECDIKNPLQNFNLRNYLREEIWQSSRRFNEVNNFQEQICGPFRNRVWKFLSIPQYFESFMFYGLLQCLDHILMVYTFLPLRCMINFISFLSFITFSLVGICVPSLKPQKFILYATDARELVKFSFVCICTIFLYTFDSSIAYHEIRTQSIIKIYIFFNLLEVADRLLSAVYLDAVDDVLFTVSAGLSGLRRQRSSSGDHVVTTSSGASSTDPSSCPSTEVVGLGALFVQYLFALACLSAHCLLLLAQVTTLNVAFNSQNRSLLTVIISNNFVELKGNVFRKMGKSNLFQIACADVRERFHYAVWLFIIVCRNMSASGWQYEDFLALLPDILLILLAEIAVDWIKHAFISKFNVIASDVYEEYTVSIAYDLLLCRQGKNTSDYFELLARRMGLTPISLSCLINVMIIQTVKSSLIYIFLLLALPLLFALKVLVHIILLNRAYAHVQAYTQMMTAKLAKEASMTATTTTVSAVSTKTSVATAASSGRSAVIEATDEVEVKRKTSIFYPPYTGYDQPTRDEGQLAMPRLPPRRSHSDTNCVSSVVVTECPSAATVATNPTAGDDEETNIADEVEEDFCSLQSLSTDTSAGWLRQRSFLKTPPSDKEARFRHILMDADDMQVCHRRIVQLPSPSTSPKRAGTLDSPNQLGLSPCSTTSYSFTSSLYEPIPSHQQRQEPHHPTSDSPLVPLSTSSWKTIPYRMRLPSHIHRSHRRRRCFSLDDVASISAQPQEQSLQSPTSPSSRKEASTMAGEVAEKHVHFTSRRRLHTENETSSLLILEQLSSTLNDETAHLEDAVDVDLLCDEEVAATDAKGGKAAATVVNSPASKVEEGMKNASRPSPPSPLTEDEKTTAVAAEASVKQPLSNVDRYSMLGGQIS
uniref:Membrane proteinTapt1 CMV receptor n=1 Tax=Echinococcus granulosus TaxID=6210 RepID=A0A068WFP4_ECHGR|nr:Membrane proteinTapt1 CMV receptor [Echinococcus granulosus]